MKHLLLTLPLLLVAGTSLLAQNRLVPADNVTELHRVWVQEGVDLTADRYGRAVWGGVDLTGDSIGDFAVYRSSTSEWYFYAGGNPPEQDAFWVKDSVGRVPPYVGSFTGDTSLYWLFRSGYREVVDGFSYFYDILELYHLMDTSENAVPYEKVDQGKLNPPIERSVRDVRVLDVNGDQIPDVVSILGGIRVGQQRDSVDNREQIWIHLGGPEFTLATPDIIIVDTGTVKTETSNWDVRFADFDGDGYMDMMTGGGYRNTGEMLRFYWGDEDSPQSWEERDFDRNLILEHGVHGINNIVTLHIFDANGDGAADLGSYEFAEVEGNRLYMSGQGKDFRTRSFTLDDADLLYENGFLLTISAGFLNDSSRRNEPIIFANSYAQPDPDAIYMVSGGAWGPDHDYDAEYRWSGPGPIGYESRGVQDITGDGWDDFIGASATHGGIVPEGIAQVFSGGPYIPFDDPTVSVREEPVAGESGGLYLWPNPVIDELHIAWRGDLQEMPARFEVYDTRGSLVVSGDIDSLRGKAVWECADVANGHYTLVSYSSRGVQIAAVPLYIQRY